MSIYRPRAAVTGRPAVRREGSRRRARDPAAPLAGLRLDALKVSFALFIVISISSVHAYFGFLRALRPGLVLWLVCVALVVLMPQKVRWANLLASWPSKAVLALAAIACLSAPFGLSLGGSGSYLLDVYLRVVAFFTILVAATNSVAALRFFVWAFVTSGAMVGLLSFTVMEMADVSGGGARLVALHMYDANDLGLIFLTAIPLGLLLVHASQGAGRWLAGAATAVMGAAVAMTGSRGAFVGFLVVVPALFFGLGEVSVLKRAGAVVVLAAALVLGSPEGYWERIETIFTPSADYNVTERHGRLQVAKRGLGYMLERPVLGVGVANFARAEVTISEMARRAAAGEGIPYLAPHNTYVQVGAEMGVVALGLWLSILYTGTVGVWRLRARLRSWSGKYAGEGDARFLFLMCSYLPISFLGFATTSFFVSHAYTPVFYVLTSFLAGLLTHQGCFAERGSGEIARKRAGNGWSGRATPIH
jgi:O-antigen ligase